MRNAIARRQHKERAQPTERRRLGLLEKKKDYTLRAKDYNKKKAQLRVLREKATDRNDDEFYFGMVSRKGPGNRVKDGRGWKGTVDGDRGNKSLDVDTVRLLKTQDLGYVRTMRSVVAKEARRLEEEVVMAGFDAQEDEDDDDEDEDFDFANPISRPKAPRKIVFADDEEQRELLLEEGEGEAKEVEKKEEDNKHAAHLKKQLSLARRKLKGLTDAEQELSVQQAKIAKTATSGGISKKGDKIKVRTRKR